MFLPIFERYRCYPGVVPIRYALIADIVGSRTLTGRDQAQTRLNEVFTQAERDLDLVHPVWATVGDEFQAVARSLGNLIVLTTRIHLLVASPLDLRFGLGAGTVVDVSEANGTTPGIQDGSAWWAAREAIEQVHALEDSGHQYARSRYSVSEDASRSSPEPPAVNSFLLLRDHITRRMKDRERRITASVLLGDTQTEIARAERMSQSSVSEALHRSGGAALTEALSQWTQEAPR